MNTTKKLLLPVSIPGLSLNNRVVMAPMNRRRAEAGIPGPSAVDYYRQRAGAGLIITDNTAITPNGKGYLNTPGIYTKEQQSAWKEIASAVHEAGGRIFMQLVHTGRIGHPLNNEDGSQLVAPSIVRAEGKIRVSGNHHLPMPDPIELNIQEIGHLISKHAEAARYAIDAGFDGVEVHGAHGFLAEQFLHPVTNLRTDQYGGSLSNRCSFLLETVAAVAEAIGPERTGVRLSPFFKINDLVPYDEELATHQYLITELNKAGILYIHLNNVQEMPLEFLQDVRKRFNHIIILAGGFTAVTAEKALQEDLADLIAFGKPFIANPDLVERFKKDWPLADGDESTFYDGGDSGYADYPVYSQPL
ncbi:alkene reductase [Mucilaginibacter sp. HD30]